mmetsp:Transcript_36432/g.88210  ORF Transcript_36432/g.88210 Transcript_36432/m.88210 type:complete len:213 (-) Transcript_36432:1075-1713(-)
MTINQGGMSNSFLGGGFLGGVGNLLGDLNLSVLGGTDFHEFLNILLLGARHIVGGSTVMRDIKTNFFFKRIDTEHSHDVQDNEERSHQEEDPCANPDNGNKVTEEKFSLSSVEDSWEVVVSSSGHKVGLSKETNSNDTPHSVGKVNWDSIDGIIDLHLDQELGETNVDPSGDDTNDTGGPWSDNRASSSDANKSSKSTVHGHGQVVGDLSSR